MNRVAGFIADHWNGRLPLRLSVLVPLIAGHILLIILLTVVSVSGLVLIICAVMALLVVLIWQIVGTFRATDQSITGARGLMPAVSYGAMVLILGSNMVQIIGLIIPDWQGSRFQEKRQHALSVSADGTAFLLQGDITLRVFTALEDMIAAQPDINRMILRSNGGNIYAARGMARLVETAGLQTSVDGVCFSACTLVFVAGSPRELPAGAKLGFHGYAVGTYANLGNVVFHDAAEEQEHDRAYYRSRGISEAFLSRIYDADHQELWQPTRDELDKAGVFTK